MLMNARINNRIIIYLDTLRGGGVERVCLDYERILRERGWRVLIVPRDGSVKMPLPKECEVINEYDFRASAAQEIGRILGSGDHIDSTIFMFHMRKSAEYLARNISFFGSTRSCLFIHASLAFSHGLTHESPLKTLKPKHFLEFWRIPRIINKNKVRLAELCAIHDQCKIFAVSDEMKVECESFGFNNVRVLENGIDFDRINQLAKMEQEGLPRESYIVHVARLSKEKRQDMLLRAYAKSKSFLKLVLVGAGPLRSKLEALAAELNISQSVVFTGYLENPYSLIAKAKFSIICSECEGFGLSIAESLGLGIPVLMTDRPYGIRNILVDYAPSLTCEDDEDALADRIQQLSQAALPTYCEEHIIEHLDLQVVVDRFLKSFGFV
jgi:glycosyltransferase involved in cell wall biosynthesis